MGIDEKIGARIAARRENAGLTLDGLAQATGISRASISRIERGETSPSAQNLGALCAVFGTTMSELLYDIEDNQENEVHFHSFDTWVEQSGYRRTQLAPSARGFNTEIIMGEIPPGVILTYKEPKICGVEEHIIMLSGQLRFVVNGKEFHLKAGDVLRFKINGVTEFENTGDVTNKYIVVVLRE